jgi:hypothetical protein
VDDWTSIAAANNAEWCDAFCRSHGIQTRLEVHAWTARTRTPRFYPDAVTLSPDVGGRDLLGRIDTSAGCSIKDSFAALDLVPHGFDVVFRAHWLISTVLPSRPSGDLRWEVVHSPDVLAEWEAAWATDVVEMGRFPVALLEQDSVFVVAGRCQGRVVAGAVLNRSARVVGLSNFFVSPEHQVVGRSDCLAFAASLVPGAPLCGYEAGSGLADALRLGFETVGVLQVWASNDQD